LFVRDGESSRGDMGKIRVLHVIKTLNLGGAEANLLNLVQAMDPQRHEHYVAYLMGGEFEPLFKKADVKLIKLSQGNHTIKSAASMIILVRLVFCIIKHRIDIVHTHNFSAHVWGILAAKITRCRILEHVHDFRYMDPQEFKQRRGLNEQYKYIKFMKNTSDAVVVLTKQNREFLLRKGLYTADRIQEVQNGIAVERKSDGHRKGFLKKRLGLSEKSSIVLTASRMAPEKNIDLILDIATEVIPRHPNVVFLIAGDGPLLTMLRRDAREKRISDQVRFVGFYPHVEELLEISDIFLLPSYLELHSIALIEALNKKVPVVVSQNVGCHDEFIASWKNGILLDPFKKEGWPRAIMALLSDRKLRTKLGEAGHQLCRKNFDITDVSSKFGQLYAELCAS